MYICILCVCVSVCLLSCLLCDSRARRHDLERLVVHFFPNLLSDVDFPARRHLLPDVVLAQLIGNLEHLVVDAKDEKDADVVAHRVELFAVEAAWELQSQVLGGGKLCRGQTDGWREKSLRPIRRSIG